MQERLTLTVVVLSVVIAVAVPMSVESAEPFGSVSSMTQLDVALEIYQAAHVNRHLVDADEALRSLQVEGVIPVSWDGQGVVTMAEIGRIMNQMGIEVRISNPGERVAEKKLDALLSTHRTEIVRAGESWEAKEQFTQTVTLGDSGRRIISGSDW